MALAIHTGVPAREWLDDPQAMLTAWDLLEEIETRQQRRGR